jgi:hypothetical protein
MKNTFYNMKRAQRSMYRANKVFLIVYILQAYLSKTL